MFGALLFAGSLLQATAADDHKPSELVGAWRGTSTCVDRVAAPACRDEVVIYEFAVGAKPGTVHWKADKVVEGQRATMGELELAYDAAEACWAAEFKSPRVDIVWCLKAQGDHLTGTGRHLPGKETVRRIDLRKD
jgi:hypothetical protein